MQEIENVADSIETLRIVVFVAFLINIGMGHPADKPATQFYNVEPQVRAMSAISQISRAQTMKIIQLLIVMYDNDLNCKE